MDGEAAARESVAVAQVKEDRGKGSGEIEVAELNRLEAWVWEQGSRKSYVWLLAPGELADEKYLLECSRSRLGSREIGTHH